MKGIKKMSWFESLRYSFSSLLYDYPPESDFFLYAKKLAKTAPKLNTVNANEEIKKYFGKTIPMRDSHYYAVPEKLLLDFYEIYPKPKYKTESFDCDNFSLDFMAFFLRFGTMIPEYKYSFAFGMVSGYFDWANGHHQVNFFVTDGGVKIFEPQTGRVHDSFKSTTLIYL